MTIPERFGKVLSYVEHKKSCTYHHRTASNFQKSVCSCGKDAAVQAMFDEMRKQGLIP